MNEWLPAASAPARAFERDLERVAPSAVSVLFVGESGSGKTSAARRLHALSPRHGGPLVEVDLAALAPSLLEAELFGHESGAFTGAERARPGRFQRASGGTLVLEGIERLPLELQVKLLRSLQERVVEPLGALEPVPVDVRVVATSSLDVQSEVDAGHFRADLYYRLAVVTLRVPALRARREELPVLAVHLARRVAERARVPARELGPGALERLLAHPWPGNLRELENALERVAVLAPREGPQAPGAGPRTPPPVEASELDFLGETLDGVGTRLAREALAHGIQLEELGQAMILAALEQEGGNQSAAARRLGLSRRAFEYRRAKLLAERPAAGPEEAD